MSYGLRYKDSERLRTYIYVYTHTYTYICELHDVYILHIYIYNEMKRKNFGEEKNPLKYNVLPVSNADVKKVDEYDFLSCSEKDDSICCTRIYNNAHRVENRLLYTIICERAYVL